MTKLYVALGLIIMSPILIPIIIFESTIAIPILTYAIIRMKIKEIQRAQSHKLIYT